MRVMIYFYQGGISTQAITQLILIINQAKTFLNALLI
jgi:hypothetical protein